MFRRTNIPNEKQQFELAAIVSQAGAF